MTKALSKAFYNWLFVKMHKSLFRDFLLFLALCHSIITEKKDGKIIYNVICFVFN